MALGTGRDERLVVYGTLAPGLANHHAMDGMTGAWLPARVRGHRRTSGIGEGGIYPGFVPDSTGPEHDVLLFVSPHLPAHFPRLDAFEGEDYARVEIVASVEGQKVDAWVYAEAAAIPVTNRD